jgi:A/G-specific adenine glycosylase
MKIIKSGSSVDSRRLRGLSRLPSKSEVTWFRRRLRFWFENNRRDFPWRHSADPYLICMSEIFLQQTSARKVAGLIGVFADQYPDWNTLAKATPAEIETVIYPLGIYRKRARTVHSLANAIVNLDSLPRTRRGLENLPGIGQYIANVLMVTLQGKRMPFLDVNMARVLERFFGPRELADIRYDPYLQTLARKVVNANDPLSANWMILDFAALVCTKKRPRCSNCPLSECCLYGSKSVPRLLHGL